MTREKSAPSLVAEGGETIAAHLELLADMGRDFAASLDIEASLALALERITRHLDGEGGALFLLDETGETLRCEASVGVSEITGLTLKSGTGIVGRCVQGNRGEMVRDVAKDSGFYGGVDAETGVTTRSILCAPMGVKDERIGAIEIINKLGGDGLFNDADLNVLQALSSSAALAVLNARMAAALVEQERVKRELELAAEIQRSLLPAARPAPFPVHGVNHPARTVSGDFYDFFTLADGRVCFNLGDVSGKGMNAALLMAKTASLFRCLGKTLHDPGRLLGLINAEICETVTRGMFVTMVGGVLDPATGRLRLANAGHEPPLHHARDGAFKALAAEAPPLGIATGLVADDVYPETELDLDGGTLYVFTDGVTEGYLDDGTTFEVEGLKASIAENGALALADRLDAVVGRVKRGGDALRDDVTILGVEDVRRVAQPWRLEWTVAADSEALLHLRFPARAERLKGVRGAVGEAAARCGCGADAVRDVVIAVDEACQNVIRHAYGEGSDGEIVLDIRCQGDAMVVDLRDFADTVAPEKIKPRDLDDIKPGGLGIHFMREVMDSVEFLVPPEGRGNLLRMVKRIS